MTNQPINLEELRKAIEHYDSYFHKVKDNGCECTHCQLCRAAEAYLHSQENRKKWTAEELFSIATGQPITDFKVEFIASKERYTKIADAINKGNEV